MTELSYAQQRELVEQLEDALTYDLESPYDPTDTVSEVVDSWLPVYYHRIREAWVEAGCPEPEDTMPDNIEGGIHHLMTLGLWEVAHLFASSAIWGDDGSPITHREAVENMRAKYPDWVAQKVAN